MVIITGENIKAQNKERKQKQETNNRIKQVPYTENDFKYK